MNTFYTIKYPVTRPGLKKRWIRIGSATKTQGEFGETILCTLEATPLNWDGTFALFPATKGDERVEKGET